MLVPRAMNSRSDWLGIDQDVCGLLQSLAAAGKTRIWPHPLSATTTSRRMTCPFWPLDRSLAAHHDDDRSRQNPHVEPERALAEILLIEPYPIIISASLPSAHLP